MIVEERGCLDKAPLKGNVGERGTSWPTVNWGNESQPRHRKTAFHFSQAERKAETKSKANGRRGVEMTRAFVSGHIRKTEEKERFGPLLFALSQSSRRKLQE
jgi:hypothetical protein